MFFLSHKIFTWHLESQYLDALKFVSQGAVKSFKMSAIYKGEMGTGLGWEGNRLIVQMTGDPFTAAL